MTFTINSRLRSAIQLHGHTKRTRIQDLAAERQRRYRHRLAVGRIALSINVDEVHLTEALIAEGLLDRADAEDREKISKALEKVIEVWIGSRYA